MAFIVSHQELARHPKTKRAARMLGVSIPTMIGHLHLLWYWALDYGGEDGDLSRFEAEDIAEAALWEGDAQPFVDALVSCALRGGAGFLERTDDGRLLVHDWYVYMAPLLNRRRKNAEYQREWRERQRGQAQSEPAPHPDETVSAYVSGMSASRKRPTEQNLTEHNREREKRARARARTREGQGATADAAPVSLSLSLVNAVDAEPEAEQKPEPEPIMTPVATSDPLHEACVVALGHGPTTGRMRRKWRDGLADLANLNVTPDDVPKLVRQYRAKYGDQIPCEPWNLADRYPELGVHPYVTVSTHATNGHTAAHLNGSGTLPQASPDPADYTRRKRQALAELGVALPALPPAATGTDPTTPH